MTLTPKDWVRPRFVNMCAATVFSCLTLSQCLQLQAHDYQGLMVTIIYYNMIFTIIFGRKYRIKVRVRVKSLASLYYIIIQIWTQWVFDIFTVTMAELWPRSRATRIPFLVRTQWFNSCSNWPCQSGDTANWVSIS